MGKKLDEAYYRLLAEANHHTRLAQAKDEDYENGFALGFVEALRIVASIREQGVSPIYRTNGAKRPSKRLLFGTDGDQS
jgi:hypothetical protein